MTDITRRVFIEDLKPLPVVELDDLPFAAAEFARKTFQASFYTYENLVIFRGGFEKMAMGGSIDAIGRVEFAVEISHNKTGWHCLGFHSTDYFGAKYWRENFPAYEAEHFPSNAMLRNFSSRATN